MARKIGSSISCVATSFSSPFQFTRNSRVRFSGSRQFYSEQLGNAKVVKKSQFPSGKFKLKEGFLKQKYSVLATSEDLLPDTELEPDEPEQDILTEDLASVSTSDLNVYTGGTGGKPGLISFYNRPYTTESEVSVSCPGRNENNVLWFVAPAVLVASFIFPSLYLRRVLSTVFEDSLLTDFLILFFTEALFYCGVAIFIVIVDYLWRSIQPLAAANDSGLASQLGHRVTTVAVLVLSLTIPMVTMGLVWPWTGPAASATLAPYLVGIVVQFAFEQYGRYVKSPSWPVIPVIFQTYRLHQLNRAAQLVTALSFTVRGAEMTSHNVAINSSLGTLLNVLQFLGVICIWSLSSFLMRFLPSATSSEQ